MSSTTIEVPDSLLKQAQKMAEEAGMTLAQFISSALAEKMAAWTTVEYLKQRAAHGDRDRFERALDKVPDVGPEEIDRLN